MVWMLIKDENNKKAADAELKRGSSTFLNVAQKYSIAPNAAKMAYHFPEQRVANLGGFGADLQGASLRNVDLTGADLTTNRLKDFDTVVIGVRAFNVRTDLAAQMPACR